MKTPNTTPTTRASLLTTASCNNRWFASLLASTAVLGSAALATDWVGDVSTDWNDPLNWSGDAGTGGSNAVINLASPTATISSNTLANPVDIFVGTGGGTNGRLDHTAGVASTGGGNWMFVGHNGGTGVYNLANTAGSGGTYTGMGQGTGTFNATGRLYVGGYAGTGSNGTVNVHTTGALAISSELNIGTNASVGVMNVDSGTITNNNWLRVGAGSGSTGTLRISGGSVTKAGNDHLIVGDNAGSSGTITLDAGSLTVNNECWIGQAGGTGVVNINGGTLTNNSWVAIGRASAASNGTVNQTGGTWNKTGGGRFIVGDNSVGTYNLSGTGALAINDEFWVGQGGSGNGTLVMSGGSITSNSWVAVGREGGTANATMSGGTWTKTGNGTAYIIGASGPATFNHTGGLVDVQGGDTWMGENNLCNYTLSGTGEFKAGYFQVARNGSSTGNVALNGGTLRANQIVGGGGIENVSFNGTQIIARVDQANFIGGMDAAGATIDAGGLLVDSNGFTLTAPQAFDGSGGVVKTGAGSLALTGGNSYTGNNVLSAGTLTLSASGSGTGAITTADGTTLGITAPFFAEQLTASAVTLGTSAATTLNLNLGDVAGSNPTNSILDVTGALTVNGAVTVNVAGAKFAVGDIPLVSYNAASLTGAGSFVLGTLPSGVVATLVTDPNYFGAGLGAVYLDITSVALPEWDGTNEAVLAKSGDTVAASADVTVVNASGIAIGQVVRGAGIPTGATVTAINGLVITLDQAATATATFVDLDFVVTAGTNEGLWDTTTQNWIDQVTTLSSLYADPNPALFSDLATGPTAVVLNVTVNPSEVTFNNSTLVYSLSGTGSISGSTGLLKQGSAGLTVNNTNAYTGVTRLEGGTTSVATLTNGGVASPLGAASSAPANLVLAGGTLDYTGGAVSIDRGLTIDGNSALVNAGNLSVSGQVLRISGGITKTGAGSLTLTNASNSLGAFRVNEGSLAFDGSGGPQTNTATGLFLGAGVSVDLPNDTTLACAGDVNIGDVAGAASTFTLSGNAVFSTPNRVMTGMNAGTASGAIMVSGTSQFNMTGGWLSVGQTGGGSLTVKDSGTFSMTGGDFNITDLDNSTGTLNLQDSGTINAVWTYWGKNTGTVGTINIAGGTFNTSSEHYVASGAGSSATVTQTGGTVNMNGGYNPIGRNGTAVWNLSAGTVNSNGWSIVGRDGTGIGTLNVSGGVFNQTQIDRPLMIGEFGSGTLTVSGTGEVNSNGNNGLILANEPAGTGIVNLDGGTLTVKRVREGNDGNGGNGGTSTFHFNGGVLKAAVGANANFLSGLTSAVVDAGGAFIDTNGQTVAIAQALDDGGGDLTKQGAGTLQLNGANGYFGSTTVAAGTLAGTGSVTGSLVVSATGSVNPGITAGTFTVGDGATIAGSYVCELDGATGDNLAVSGALTLSAGAVLDINELSAPTASVYVIASYSSLSGTFTTVNDLPAGYSVDYNYLGGNQIALVKPLNAYETWASSYGLDPLTDGAAAVDADDDGQSNGLEFALGGSPVSGSDNAKVYRLEEDSGDVGSAKELLLTIAVRSGAPAFAGSPSPTATHDGATYTVQGSTDLATFATAVSVVAPVTTGLPAAPAGYEYRTFSLDGSDGLPSKGFLRVDVTP